MVDTVVPLQFVFREMSLPQNLFVLTCVCPPMQAEPDKAPKFEVKVDFSGEEVGGRYLDLHDHFRHFINAKFGRKLEYPEYVSLIAHFDDIPRQQRSTKAYR
jgi:hypothetical protein